MARAADDLLHHAAGARAVVVGGAKTGAAAARVLVQLGATVTLVDDAPAAKVADGIAKHGLDPAAITLRAGGIDAAIVAGADLVVLSPGVPRAHAALQGALAAGVPLFNEIELAAAVLPSSVAVIAVTGTNGKSTTTTMAGAIASAADARAFVGGNLGTPYCQAALDMLAGAPPPRFAVLELSSYQLETIGTLAVRAAVVTNLSPDHLDRYPDVGAYYAAKARVFALVAPGGGVSLNAADAESRAHLTSMLPRDRARCDFDVPTALEGIAITPHGVQVRWGSVRADLTLANPRIVGHHNRQNAAAAVAGALLAGIPPEAWQAGLDAYAGIAHRLERIGEARGVVWYNDSKATNVDAAVTGLKSFLRGVHLIAGGLGKGAPYAPLVDAARDRVRAVYTIGRDAPAIEAAFADVAPVVSCGTLEVACERAAAAAVPDDVILLSPACASFDQFRDYAHRGDAFRQCFRRLGAGDGQEVG
ncbi:MAG: UDP-N-acetylmuramoyl-L-alanine--D-glutamate ligase [Deltaproteobacteria bacterium]|nr:UDP-N-acetylmuramoyl-L-alanine--D-glutamate ligase [Deltaproteobacteria bacterium]